MSLKLLNGKFYDSAGNVVPLEFGNKEQIFILDSIESMARDGEEPNVHFSEYTGRIYRYYIDCVACGAEVSWGWKRHMEGRKENCKCGMVYVMNVGDYGEMVAKLIRK